MQVLAPGSKAINVNDHIMDLYLQRLLPGITEPGDDNNYGSSAMGDVLCLQALSKRIHYGKFVAEAKFRCVGADLVSTVSVRTAPHRVAAPSCCNTMPARCGCMGGAHGGWAQTGYCGTVWCMVLPWRMSHQVHSLLPVCSVAWADTAGCRLL